MFVIATGGSTFLIDGAVSRGCPCGSKTLSTFFLMLHQCGGPTGAWTIYCRFRLRGFHTETFRRFATTDIVAFGSWPVGANASEDAAAFIS